MPQNDGYCVILRVKPEVSKKQKILISSKERKELYVKKILWYLDIPKGAKGSMIEC